MIRMSSPLGLNVDDIVEGEQLNEIIADELGYASEFSNLKQEVVFASFSDESIQTYTDYNRVFRKSNSSPLNFPASGETYPDSSGLGVGNGLKFNTGTLIIKTDKKVSGLRVKPECSLSVSVSSGLNGIPQFVGTTIPSDSVTGTSEFQFLQHATHFLILEHEGSLSLLEIELFTSTLVDAAAPQNFAVFPIIKDTRKTLPYLVSTFNQLSVNRKGGLQNVEAVLFTVELSKHFEATRLASRDILNLPLEDLYLNEVNLYNHILKDANLIFPLLSAIERNCIRHRAKTQDSIAAINQDQHDFINQDQLECTILSELNEDGVLMFNGIIATNEIHLVSNVRYIFSPETVEIEGTELSELRLSEGEIMLFGKNGSQLGSFKSNKTLPQNDYTIPTSFMNDESLETVLSDFTNSSSLLNTSFEKTPNSGNVISHACFLNENGDSLTVEESLFLPGDTKNISVYCSEAGSSIQVLIDGQLNLEVSSPPERSLIIQVKLPTTAGVHCLSTNNGSNVLFRITKKSIIHPPVHPPYYTSGQLERDIFSTSTVEFIAQHNNFDLLPDSTITAQSQSSLISIDDVTFDHFSCTSALYSRKKAVDLKNEGLSFEHLQCRWEFCSDHPWLACLNIQHGCTVLHSEINLDNFTISWYPTILTDLTLIQGKRCLFILDDKLTLSNEHEKFECNLHRLELSSWNHLAFTNERFIINGHEETTTRSNGGRNTLTTTTVIGTCHQIDLEPVLVGNPIDLPDFASDRLHECQIELTFGSFIPQIELTTSDGVVLTWENTNPTSQQANQSFQLTSLYSSDSIQIASINLPFSISMIKMKFASAGFIRNLCTYDSMIPAVVIDTGRKNRDCVIDFQRKLITSTCTNQELNIVKTEHYTQTNFSASAETNEFVESSVQSSFYVTPPSLIMMSTSQDAPYSTNQSILLLFNRRIETFPKDDSTLFTISGDDGTVTLVKARNVTLLSSQISISNTFLSLSPATNYNINLSAGRLFQTNGRVPNIEGNISFSTL